MRAKNFKKMVVLVVCLVCVSVGYVRADKLQLQEKLSKDIDIQIRDVTITEALGKIGQKAGVKIVLSDEAAWKLPYGEATRLSISLSGPLADSMTEMLNAFFMRYALGDEEITIYPRPELEHILGRPTTKQLELLKAIYTRPIKTYFLDHVQGTINEALGQEVLISPIHVHAQLNNFLRQLVGKEAIYEEISGRMTRQRSVIKPSEPEPNEPEATVYNLPTPVTLVQLLSQVIVERDPTATRWYISGIDFPGQIPEIRAVSSQIFTNLRLNQKIDLTYRNEGLDKIFQDLANRAGVPLVIAPGSYLNEHKVNVKMQNLTIEQAARNIADLVAARSCDIDGHSIQIVGPGKPDAKEEKTLKGTSMKDSGDANKYVGKISIPMDGGKYYIEFMLRESDLTEELKKLRAERMKEILGQPPKPKP